MRLSIGIITHSTNPRGGVVHGMALAESLCDAGHSATLIAPDVTGSGFFRTPSCETRCIPARAMPDLPSLVEQRIIEIREHLRHTTFDVLHAQDPISANALADLTNEGALGGFARTVHHLDRFSHPGITARQARGVHGAAELFTVSRLWEEKISADYGRAAPNVGNGVDIRRFSPELTLRDVTLRARYAIPRAKRLILSVGGIEQRKNTLALLDVFLTLRAQQSDLHLVIAGGASLLDHSCYRAQFDQTLRASGQGDSVTVTGPVADCDMPALYRQSSVLAYPSLAEGFGLCPLEALACGTPAVVPQAAPFTEHLGPDDVFWCQPDQPASLARALCDALAAGHSPVNGPRTARRFDWMQVAARHIPAYRRLTALSHASTPQPGALSSCRK